MPEPEEPPPITIQTTPIAQDEDEFDHDLYDAQEKAKALKALFATRVYVEPDGEHLRVTMGERVGDENIYHTALVIPLESALEFGRLLVKMAEAGVALKWDRYREFLALGESSEGEPNG